MTSAATRLFALLGHPVAHSRSPAMMTHAFAALGLDAAYVACDVAPADLHDAVRGLRALDAAGANVTIPHKAAALALSDAADPAARAIGAANTLVFARDRTVAYNTDAPGAVAALTDAGVAVAGARVVVLGSGGAARAVAVGVALAGAAEVAIVARRPDVAQDLVSAVTALGAYCTARAVPWTDSAMARDALTSASVVVQATPLGMTGHAGSDDAEIQRVAAAFLDVVPPSAAAMDLVYAPRQTAWLRAAEARGLRTVDGLGMLAHQGALALAHWLGRDVPATLLRRFLDAGATRE